MALEEEGAFYDENRAEFREKYMDKWLVIAGRTLWGVYDALADAVSAALEHLKPGEFMVHKPADDGKVISIGGRVYIEHPDDAARPKPKREAIMTYTSGSGSRQVTFAY